jgi:hypothetical protein
MRSVPVRGAALLTLLTAGSAVVAGCSGGGSPAPHVSGSPSSTYVATRWWSNTADSAGSTIDPNNPGAAAGQLQPSRTTYCSMLKQTVAAQKSILPGVTAGDPALLASTRAFVAEIEAVAPSQVSSQWRVLGEALTKLVASGGNPAKVTGLDTKAITAAADAVSADAKAQCQISLS